MAEAYASARGAEGSALPPVRMRVGLVIARTVWQGEIRAIASATPLPKLGWAVSCEVRDDEGRLLSIALGVIDTDPERQA